MSAPPSTPVGFWIDRRVLVTGATGLVGSWLVKRLLAEQSQVVALVLDADPQSELIRSGDINRVTVVNGALEDFAAVERAINLHDVDTVFHLGAQTLVGTALRYPLATFEANVRGTYHVLEACRLHRSLVQRVIIASTDKSYGEAERLPYTEDMPLAGRHPYDVSKSCTDLLTQGYHRTYDLPVAISRCGNIYGGGDLHWSRIVPGTIRSLWRGERPMIRSDGTFVRDYIYITDVVEAYLQLGQQLDRPGVRGEAFNFSTESYMTVTEIVAAIQKLMNRQDLAPVVLNEAKAEIRKQTLSAQKARRLLGWQHQFDLESGLRETVAWYRSYLDSTR